MGELSNAESCSSNYSTLNGRGAKTCDRGSPSQIYNEGFISKLEEISGRVLRNQNWVVRKWLSRIRYGVTRNQKSTELTGNE